MATWRPLGVPWAPTLLPEPSRSRPGEALGRPGVPQKVVVGGQGASWGEKLIDFTLLGAPWEGPGGALGGHFRSFFAVGPAGTEKVRKMKTVCIFWGGVFLKCFVSFLFALPAAPAEARTLKNRFSCGKYSKFRLSAIFSRSGKRAEVKRILLKT